MVDASLYFCRRLRKVQCMTVRHGARRGLRSGSKPLSSVSVSASSFVTMHFLRARTVCLSGLVPLSRRTETRSNFFEPGAANY